MNKNIVTLLLILRLFGQIQAMEQYKITDKWSYGAPQEGDRADKLKKSLELSDTLFSSCTKFMNKDSFPAQSNDQDCPTCLNNQAKINNLSVREDFFNKLRDKIAIALEKNNASEINIATLGGAHMGFEFILLHSLNLTLQNKTINLINLEGGKHNQSNEHQRTIKSFFNNYFDEDNIGCQDNNNEFNFYYFYNQTQEYLELSKKSTPESLNVLMCLCLNETPDSIDKLSEILFQNNITNENDSMAGSFSLLCENLPENSIVGLLAGNTMTFCSLVGEKQDKESYNCNLYLENANKEVRIENDTYSATRQSTDDESSDEKEEVQNEESPGEDFDSETGLEKSSNLTTNFIPNGKKDLQNNSLITKKTALIGTSIIGLVVALYLSHNWTVENKDWHNTLLHKIPFFKNN